MKEVSLEVLLAEAVKKSGGLCLKMPAAWYRGIPDRLILLPGSVVMFVELKTDRNNPSNAQLFYQKTLRKLGVPSYLIRGRLELDRFIHDNIFPGIPLSNSTDRR